MDQRGSVAVASPRTEGVDAQRPALAEHPQLRSVQVEAQQVQRGREQEQGEEDQLETSDGGAAVVGGGQRGRGAVA
jgi:hypothetical protein